MLGVVYYVAIFCLCIVVLFFTVIGSVIVVHLIRLSNRATKLMDSLDNEVNLVSISLQRAADEFRSVYTDEILEKLQKQSDDMFAFSQEFSKLESYLYSNDKL